MTGSPSQSTLLADILCQLDQIAPFTPLAALSGSPPLHSYLHSVAWPPIPSYLLPRGLMTPLKSFQMLVDDVGDVTITNDGATILKLLEVEHPAARILVDLAELQDAEVGDGTTSVVIIAAELLKRAGELVRNKIHPTSIIAGYRLAMREVRCPCIFQCQRGSEGC